MKHLLYLFISTCFFCSCNTKSSLNLTIVETGTGLPVEDAQVDIIEVSFGGTLGNPSTSSILLESIFTDENGEIRFNTREEFDKIEVEITKDGYFDVIPDDDPRYAFFDLAEGDRIETTFEMDPEAILEFRIIDDPDIQEGGIQLSTGFIGTSIENISQDQSINGIVHGNQHHIYRYWYFNDLTLMLDSVFISKDSQNFVELSI